MIPKGLPGEGNILIFDNGGWSGYGLPTPTSPTGFNNAARDFSRVLEIDPSRMKIIWSCLPKNLGHAQPFHAEKFYSCFISAAQRLPNGNTLITEGADGRLLEITHDYELVWEYISPYWGTFMPLNHIYRAYRYPYDYVPQIPKPTEVPVEAVDNTDFRMPGAKSKEFKRFITVDGTIGYGDVDGFCIPKEK